MDKLKQEQLTFGITNKQTDTKYKTSVNNIECIQKYMYVAIDSHTQYLFEKDWALNQCVIASDSGEEVESVKLPLLSEISAGNPIYMNEEYDEYFYMPKNIIKNNKDVFLLKIKGDSMIEAGIDDEDYVIIRKDNYINKKSIVAVEVDGHATLKKVEMQGNKLILIPENRNYEPIIVSAYEARIIGNAIGIIKEIKYD